MKYLHMPTGQRFSMNSPAWGNVLFRKFDQVRVPNVCDFIGSIPQTFADMVNRVTLPPQVLVDGFILKNRTKLQKCIRKFHIEANTMTTAASDKISSLCSADTQIYVSTHQPNLFPYAGIFKKIVLLHTLKASFENIYPNRNAIDLFVIIDHDFMDELWVHLAQLPSIWNSSGTLEIRVPVSKSVSRKMIYNTRLPARAVLDSWKTQVRSWMAKSVSSNPRGSRIIDNFNRYWIEVEESFLKAKTYGDFNSFLMSQLVNRVWKYDSLFVRVSDLSPVFEDGFKYLVTNSNAYSEALRKTENVFTDYGIKTNVSSTSYDYGPLWLHCDCGSKAPTKITNQQEWIILTGECLSCKKTLREKINGNRNLGISEELIHFLSPRAIPLLLLLSRDLGVTCYCSGVGAVDYIIYAAAVFDYLSIKRPLIVFWPSRDVYYGIGQSQALSLIGSAQPNVKNPLDGLAALKKQEIKLKDQIKALIAERSRQVKNGEPFDLLLADLFKLKGEQRNIRKLISLTEKGAMVLKMSPCLIDYAVNFGIENIESYWRRSLPVSQELSAPIYFNEKALGDNKKLLNLFVHHV